MYMNIFGLADKADGLGEGRSDRSTDLPLFKFPSRGVHVIQRVFLFRRHHLPALRLLLLPSYSLFPTHHTSLLDVSALGGHSHSGWL